ncbi:MAG: c-type cytochrome [Acidobacteriota bacterium]
MKSARKRLARNYTLRLLALCSLPLFLSGCTRGCTSRRPPIHLNPNMDNQPKYRPQAASRFFPNGSTQQAPIPGAIARGELRENDELYTGKSLWGFFIDNPLEMSAELISRGEERFGIYCVPCHGSRADGKGMLYQRSKIESRDLLEDRVREMPDGRIYDVITNGTGLMKGYRYPIPPRDRWAIVGYVRELQKEGVR